MKQFEHPNMFEFKCPICGTSEDKPIVMIPIAGTEEGNKMQAVQVHVDCIDLTVISRDDNTTWLVQLIENM